jgi:Zn-dependent protease with chaperone function
MFLTPIVQDCAGRLGLHGLPRVLMNDDRMPNASAWTRHLVINQGLLDEFNYDRDAIASVVCHELAHWNNADPVASAFVRGVSLPLYLIYAAASAVMTRFRHPVVHLLVWLVFWPVLVTFRYFIVPTQAADSRAAEYHCDQAAAYAGHRDGMRRVLARLRRSFDGSRNGWELAICATHPPNELRLEAIEEPGRDYPLPDPDAPARPIPVAMISTLDKD